MQELIEEVLVWQNRVFPRATIEAVRMKLVEEVEELGETLLLTPNNIDAVADEIADVVIVATRWLDMHGKNIEYVVRAKMEINRGRVFGPELENGDRRRVK